MKYYSKIEVSGDRGAVYPCFATEMINKDRSNFTVKKGKNKVAFEIKAKDAVAFRATANMITQLLAVYEKIGRIEKK